MIAAAIVLLALSSQPDPPVFVKHVEAIEINRYGCWIDNGGLCGGSWQVIYWDRMHDGMQHVRYWRPIQGGCDIQSAPYGWNEWRYVGRTIIEMRCRDLIESEGMHDPEMDDRARGVEWRRDIWR